MFLQVAETLCQHLSLLDSETKKKKRKEKEKRRENLGQMRCMRKRGRRGGKMDEGS